MNMFHVRSTLSKTRARWRNQRGAVIVETALAIPILLMVIMGSIEFGFAWEAKSATASGVRTGVLRAASIGDQPETDMRILQSIIGEIGTENVDRIEYVMVFNATGHTDKQAAIDGCAAGAGTTQCALYSTSVLQAVSATADPAAYQAANFDLGGNVTRDGAGDIDGYACTFGKLDTNWCAGSRTVLNDVEIGIAVKYNHEWVTGIIPFDAPVFDDYSISSTFLSSGSQISPSAVGVTTGTATNYSTDFTAGGTLSGNPDVTWTGADDSDIKTTHPTATAPRDYLGRFGKDEVLSLQVDNLAAHNNICVSFDLIIIGSWDSDPRWGPDYFQVDIDADGDLEHNVNYAHNQTDDASEEDTLGFQAETGTGWGDHVVPVTICQPHTSSTLNIDFKAVLTNSNLNNESWAIDNLTVSSSLL